MQIHIITIFPESIQGILSSSMLKLAQEKKLAEFFVHDLRKWTTDKRKTVDDKPFGGGPGMVMKVESFYQAVTEIRSQLLDKKVKVLLTSAKGEKFNQQQAQTFSQLDALIILCGHYEGVDERVALHLVDAEISVGDYILTGGELPALVIVDAVVRLLPGVLGNADSLKEESHGQEFSGEYPQYTRPAEFVTPEGETWKVPDVLQTGNHQEIASWRKANSKKP